MPQTYSIRDLLVLTAVVAVGLTLLSWWATSGGASRNTSCKNNMRQLALAADAFEILNQRYPGYEEKVGGNLVPWPVALLPQLDRIDLYDVWSQTPVPANAKPYMELFVCPKNPPASTAGTPLAYVANAGAAGRANQNPANGIFLDLTDGPAGISSDDIVDGMTHTLLFSENVQAATWVAPGKRNSVFLWHPTIKPTPAMRINGGDLKGPLSSETARPSSYHEGGVNVAFPDTHVILLREDIDYKVYMQLMTSDGQNSDMPASWKDDTVREPEFK